MKIWGLALIIGLFLAMPFVALAQEVEKPAFEVSPRFPSVVGKADSVFRFKVDMNYEGKNPLILSLSAQAPQGWKVRILGGIPEIDIRDMRLEPFKTYSDQIDVELTPPRGNVVEPGEYIAVLEAREVPPGTLQSKTELKAVVTARYSLNFTTETGRLNTKVTAGKEKFFPLVLRNTSTVALEKITFSNSNPGGWSITFSPEKVDSIPIGGVQTVEAVIKPPKRTIAGDYAVTL
ncbi:NEW3 domain-containing protein, partial [Chloroflexota bacterium]